MKNTYHIPRKSEKDSHEVKKSTFISYLFHAPHMNDVSSHLQALKQKHPKARHICWACIAGDPADTSVRGFSDDGEPSGCAGKPLLKVLAYSGLGETALFVVRYFGGIKLGTGGMVKAYTTAAQRVISLCSTEKIVPTISGEITIPYRMEPLLRYILQDPAITHTEFQYSEAVRVHLSLEETSFQRISERIRTECNCTISPDP
ncbi:IMPACT family protein [Chitinivibrio alkaliphilus]|uniref:Impact N-terminal domain-containing protein n=1 Tax=Chitinivibrio alkaliphilus ACht1 TaxID=1313304 RepID=U7D5F4_9BACT|nr:YigZ family protein [Chitinivibrio alkaliphilus]ERP31183.1 hypothetical protein CALK_1894 [Chitinivibrio alkaliphilus ACht1]